MTEEKGTTSEVFDGNMDDMFTDFVTEEAPTETPQEPETPVAEGQPETAPEETPQEQEPEPTEPSEPEAPPEEQPQEQLIGGKFKTPEDVLAAYQQAERLATQRAQEAAEFRREREQIARALRQAEPIIRQAAAMQQQPNWDELDTSDPQVIQQLIHQEAQRVAAQQVAPVYQQQERQQYEAVSREIQSYRETHPDASPFEGEVLSILQEYRYDEGEEVFPPTKDNLETALTLAQNPQAHGIIQALNLHPEKEWVQNAVEVAQNPSLQQVVMAHPHVIETEAGMSWARQQAGLPTVVQQAQTNAQTGKQQEREQERKAAHVETGEGSGDLAPGRKPQDALEAAYMDEIANDAKGAIFR